MKVLNVIHYTVFGGPHNQALRLAAPLADKGFETLVVVPDQLGNAAERLRAGGVDVRQVPLGRIRATLDPRAHFEMATGMPREVSRLRALIRTEAIDIVQVGGLVNPHAAIAARLEHVPVVWQLLDTRAPRLVTMAAMVGVWGFADVVMSTGSAVARSHPGYASIADRVVPFFPPVDLQRFSPNPGLKAEIRSGWGLSADGLVVGCVANINPQKGIVELVHAFAVAHLRHPSSRLVLVGAEYDTHAEYSAAVRVQLAADGLIEGRDVLFIGGRDDVERQLVGMDVVALAAVPRSEGITTAILEAMAVGLPVVVTDVGALREAVSHEQNGLVIQPGDTDGFSAALSHLMDDHAIRARMGRQGRLAAEARFGIDSCADTHVRAYGMALAGRGRAAKSPDPAHRDRSLLPSGSNVIDGIPVYLEDHERTAHDELHHEHGHAHKSAQSQHFDTLAEAEFETERPRGSPRLYQFLLAEKFRRAVRPIGSRLAGASALTVCGGSGMDAEYFARAGASVISSDLSLGAAARARDRAARHQVAIQSIVADVEQLPFADASVDIVAVHDGLHHLADPFAGLEEMARVARRWVVVSEPARASITRLAVRLGLALETESAGNRVARLEPSEVARFLASRGFSVVRAERYAMYYPHRPGATFRLLSRPYVYPLIRLSWRFANAIVGRFGNKMVVVAERVQADPKADGAPASRSR